MVRLGHLNETNHQNQIHDLPLSLFTPLIIYSFSNVQESTVSEEQDLESDEIFKNLNILCFILLQLSHFFPLSTQPTHTPTVNPHVVVHAYESFMYVL